MKRLLLAVLAAVVPLCAAAQQQNGSRSTTGFRAEFLAELNEVEAKIVELAEATPERGFEWRPAAGIRSTGQVYLHMAGANYFLVTFLGVKTPPEMPRNIESLQGKTRIINELRKSVAHVRAALVNSTEADLDRRVRLFGRDVTRRFVYVRILNHLHEHLGQAIAYARMNNIVPPWSQ